MAQHHQGRCVMTPTTRTRSSLLLLLLLLLEGAHGGAGPGTGGPLVDGAGLETLAGTIGNHNGVRCPWACNCGGQELDCAQRGLTQVPGNLAALTLAEKL